MLAHNVNNGKVSREETINGLLDRTVSDRHKRIEFQIYPNTDSRTQNKNKVRINCNILRNQAAKGKYSFPHHTGIALLIDTLNEGKAVHFCITNKSCKAEDIEYVDTFFGDYDGWSKEKNAPKDGVATLDELKNLPSIRQYCVFFQKSSSYRDDSPNCHFQFVYDKSLDYFGHTLIIQLMVSRLNNELRDIGKAELFDHSLKSNSTHLCYAGNHQCEFVFGNQLFIPDLIDTEQWLSKSVDLGFNPYGQKKTKKPLDKKPVDDDRIHIEKSNKTLAPKVLETKSETPLEYLYTQLIDKFDGDPRCFYDLIEHEWKQTTRNLPEGGVIQYDGRNPFSGNSSGGSFSITVFDVKLPPVYYDRQYACDGDLIDYSYRFGRSRGKYLQGGIEKQFKNVVNDICDRFNIPKYEWGITHVKKDENDDENESKRQRFNSKFLRVFGEGAVRMNLMTLQPELNGEEVKFDTLATKLDIRYGIVATEEIVQKSVMLMAEEKTYHPVMDYLEGCKKKYPVYDSSVLEGLSSKYFGTKQPIYDVYVRKTLIAAVARIYSPGISFKMLLTLVGVQDAGKSTWIRNLASNDWTNTNINISNLTDKDDRLIVNKYWIHEIAEIDRIVRKFDRGTMKDFLSSPSDNYRPPYGRKITSHPRTSIFMASTNEKEILNDPTGNVRFWCIPIVTNQIDFEMVLHERDKLWAMASHAYDSGESIYLSKNDSELRDNSNKNFETQDAIEEIILPRVISQKYVYLADLMLNCQFKVEDMALQKRICQVLRKHGWERKQITLSGKRGWYWQNPNDPSDLSIAEETTINAF